MAKKTLKNVKMKEKKYLKSEPTEEEITNLLNELFPLCRSLTGEANRKTLSILNNIVPIRRTEIPTGTKIYDWVVPEEWYVKDAYIETTDGARIVDFRINNLHVVGYSVPINKMLNFDELDEHLHKHPSIPDAIPYRTSYYEKNWGFCVTEAQYEELKANHGPLRVVIDAKHINGSMTIGECLLPGESKREILISCYICHPSMANDSLSGVILTAYLAKTLSCMTNRYWSYRIIFVPETIGALAYIAMNEKLIKEISFGIVITTVGGPGRMGYKQSWNITHPINNLVEDTFKECGVEYKVQPFNIHGSDERQYSSPAFRVNCVTIFKDCYYDYKEYHSSKDNLEFVNAAQIIETYKVYNELIKKIEAREVYISANPHGEPMLSRYDLYPKSGGAQTPGGSESDDLEIMLWVLFLSDGQMSLEDISRRQKIKYTRVKYCAEILERNELILKI